MATNEPIRNWKFHYTRLIGTIGEGDRSHVIMTSPVQSVEGNIATTLNSTYVLGECDPDRTREEWIENWKYWKKSLVNFKRCKFERS